jgi:hypothetical protein
VIRGNGEGATSIPPIGADGPDHEAVSKHSRSAFTRVGGQAATLGARGSVPRFWVAANRTNGRLMLVLAQGRAEPVKAWRCDVYEAPHLFALASAVRCMRTGTECFAGFHVCPERLSGGGYFERRAPGLGTSP